MSATLANKFPLALMLPEAVILLVTFKSPVKVSVVFNKNEPETSAPVGKAFIREVLSVTPADTVCMLVAFVAILLVFVVISVAIDWLTLVNAPETAVLNTAETPINWVTSLKKFCPCHEPDIPAAVKGKDKAVEDVV